MVVLGEKLGGGPVDHSAGLGLCGSPFFESSMVCPTLLMACKRFPRTGTARRKCMCGVRGLAQEAYVSCSSGFLLLGVHRFESS
jgi:hypothetical protein